MDLSLNLTGTHVLITGGTGFIGSATVTALLSAGAHVTCLDVRTPRIHSESDSFQFFSCDISSETSLETAFANAAKRFGPIACCIALASLDLSVLPHHKSLADMSVEQWRHTHRINVEGTFLTARTVITSFPVDVEEASPTSMVEICLNTICFGDKQSLTA